MKTTLDYALDISHDLRKLLYRENIMIAISDHEKYLYYSDGKYLDCELQVGSSYFAADAVGQAIITKKMTNLFIPPDFYNIPFRAFGIPLLDLKTGESIGCLAFGINDSNDFEIARQLVSERMLDCLMKQIK